MDPEVFRPMLYGLLMWSVTIYAFRRGGWEERLTSCNMVICAYLSVLIDTPNDSFRNFEFSVATLDACSLLGQQLIAFRSEKFWPLWLAGMSGVTVLGHLAPLMPGIPPIMAYNAVALWGYPCWLLVGFAILRHDRRRRVEQLIAER